jgi:hypothetical protein
MKLMIKPFLILFTLFFSIQFFSQRKLHVYIGSGFDGKKCTLTLSYYDSSKKLNEKSYIIDSVLFDNDVTGLSCYQLIDFPKKYKKELYLTVEDKKYRFCFDRLPSNSGLRIEMYNTIDYVLLKKNNF